MSGIFFSKLSVGEATLCNVNSYSCLNLFYSQTQLFDNYSFLTTVIVLENYFNKLELSFLTAAICKQVLANKFLFSGISWTETAILIICTFMLSWLFIYRDRNLILVTKFAPFIVLLAIHRQCVQLKNQLQRVSTYTTETCKKYSVTVIFYYIFHIKPHFLKTLFPSRLLFDFDDIFYQQRQN